MSTSSTVSTGATTAANTVDTASTIAGMQASTNSALAVQAAATEQENTINNAMAVDQLSEQGPKNAKSLTSG